MAVVSVAETTNRSANVTGSGVEYMRTFLVKVNATSDNARSIYFATSGQIPRYLEGHPDNIFSQMKRLGAKPATDHWQWWHFTAEYDSDPLTVDQRDREIPNPLDRRARISWKSVTYQQSIHKDKKGNAILNSAGDPHDPQPERLARYWVATVKKNVTGIPTWVLDYDNVTNQATFTIQGRTVLPRCALLLPGGISDELEENGVKYHEIEFGLEFRKAPTLKASQVFDRETKKAKTAQGHDLVLLDQGLRHIITQGNILDIGKVVNATDDKGDAATSPVPLDGIGGKLSKPEPDTVFYFAYEVYDTADFTKLPLR